MTVPIPPIKADQTKMNFKKEPAPLPQNRLSVSFVVLRPVRRLVQLTQQHTKHCFELLQEQVGTPHLTSHESLRTDTQTTGFQHFIIHS